MTTPEGTPELAALEQYGQHKPGCEHVRYEPAPWDSVACTCTPRRFDDIHEKGCAKAEAFKANEEAWHKRERPCTCGFDAALRAAAHRPDVPGLREVVRDAVYELRNRKPNVSDEDIAEVLERAALAASQPADEREALDAMLNVEEIRRWRTTTATANEVLVALYPLLEAVRAWRDADGRKPRAIAQAENVMLDALDDFEALATRLSSEASS